MMSRRVAVIVTLVVVFAFVVVSVAPVFAAARGALPVHARLVSSSPADASTVKTATQVVLGFSEVVNPSFVAVRVAGPGGAEVDGAPVVQGREVTQALSADVPAGKHTLTYRVVSADGHPISGTITFTTTATPADTGPPSPTPTASAPKTSTPTSAQPGDAASSEPTVTAPATPASTDGAGPSWLALILGLAGLTALAAGAWRLRATRRTPARAGEASPR